MASIASLTSLGKYFLAKRVGDHAYYSNYETTHGGDRAIVSVFLHEFREEEGFADRFQDSIARLRDVSHPHVARVHDGGIDDVSGFPYVVVEAVPGPTMADLLSASAMPVLGDLATYVAQAGEGLKAMARVGLLHRDIRPGSLQLTKDGQIKLVNLGRAGLLPPHQYRLGEEIIVGSPLYIAPEIVDGRSADVRSDLYSLMATAYHIMAGKPMFQGKTLEEMLHLQKSQVPKDLPSIKPDFPGPLWDIMRDVLSKDPSARYSEYDTFLLDWNATARASGLKSGGGVVVAPGVGSSRDEGMDDPKFERSGVAIKEEAELPPDLAAIMPGRKPLSSLDKKKKSRMTEVGGERYKHDKPAGSLLPLFFILFVLGGGIFVLVKNPPAILKTDEGPTQQDIINDLADQWDATEIALRNVANAAKDYQAKNGKIPSMDELTRLAGFNETKAIDGYGKRVRIDEYADSTISAGPDQQFGSTDDFHYSMKRNTLTKRPPKPSKDKTDEESVYANKMGGSKP